MKTINSPQKSAAWILFTSTLLFSALSHAYLAVNETAEILPVNYYKLGVAPQLKLSNGSGMNVGFFADLHLFDDTDGRITIGGGDTDFFTQASVKWVPFPDVDRQPAMGGRAAIIYARDSGENFTSFQITPIVSKKTETRYGDMIPYVAIPVTFTSTKPKNFTSTQFAVGAEWFPKPEMHVGGELNLNMNDSFSSLSVYVAFPFEASTGYKKR